MPGERSSGRPVDGSGARLYVCRQHDSTQMISHLRPPGGRPFGRTSVRAFADLDSMRRGPGCKAAPSGKATAPAVPRHLLPRTNRVPGVDAALAPGCAIWEQSVCWKIICTPVHWPFGHSDEDPSSPLKGVLPTAGNTHGRARVVNRDILRSTILDGAPGGRPPGRLVSGVLLHHNVGLCRELPILLRVLRQRLTVP